MEVNCPDIDAKWQLCAVSAQDRLERRARQSPEPRQHDLAVTIEHDRVGESTARVAELPRQVVRRALADQDRIADREGLQELVDLGRAVNRDADELDAL